MNKNGIVAVVVVITAVVLVGLWVMRSGQTRPGGRQFDCSAPPDAPMNLTYSKEGDVVSGAWVAPGGDNAPTTYVIEAGSSPGLNDQGTYVVPATQTSPETCCAAMSARPRSAVAPDEGRRSASSFSAAPARVRVLSMSAATSAADIGSGASPSPVPRASVRCSAPVCSPSVRAASR